MSYGSYACYDTAVIHFDSLEKLCKQYEVLDYKMLLSIDIENLYFELSDYLDDQQQDFCNLINDRDVDYLNSFAEDYEGDFYKICEGIYAVWGALDSLKAKTKLEIELRYVMETGGDADDFNQEFYWSVMNAYKPTKVGKKFDEYIVNASWVIYG